LQTYAEFLQRTVPFPQEGFELGDSGLVFHGLDLMRLVQTYGTPLRFTYLPVIEKKIHRLNQLFQQAQTTLNYPGQYHYCYCTKSSHYQHVLQTCLKAGAGLESSSALDLDLMAQLGNEYFLPGDRMIVCNGFKPRQYQRKILQMRERGYQHLIPVLDNPGELDYYEAQCIESELPVGIRLAVEEEPGHELYTSRLGFRAEDVLPFYEERLRNHPQARLRMFHFFLQSGIRDTTYFWSELEKFVQQFCELRKREPALQYLNLGGGMPYRDALNFEFNYEYMVLEIVRCIQRICQDNNVPPPDIVTEFGSYTVAEASGVIFEVLARKQQNDREKWMMLDGSLMATLPDIWAQNQRFILLPINNWNAEYERVILGGITCDSHDFYSQDAHAATIFQPKDSGKRQFVGFFHTGAYQNALSGDGGIHHCLVPTPQHMVLSMNGQTEPYHHLVAPAQSSGEVKRILGFADHAP
jgi:arginine decarboxylase